jgi:hypothetical protein
MANIEHRTLNIEPRTQSHFDVGRWTLNVRRSLATIALAMSASAAFAATPAEIDAAGKVVAPLANSLPGAALNETDESLTMIIATGEAGFDWLLRRTPRSAGRCTR